MFVFVDFLSSYKFVFVFSLFGRISSIMVRIFHINFLILLGHGTFHLFSVLLILPIIPAVSELCVALDFVHFPSTAHS